MNITAFAVIVARQGERVDGDAMSGLTGASRPATPGWPGVMTIAMLSLAGIPGDGRLHREVPTDRRPGQRQLRLAGHRPGRRLDDLPGLLPARVIATMWMERPIRGLGRRRGGRGGQPGPDRRRRSPEADALKAPIAGGSPEGDGLALEGVRRGRGRRRPRSVVGRGHLHRGAVRGRLRGVRDLPVAVAQPGRVRRPGPCSWDLLSPTRWPYPAPVCVRRECGSRSAWMTTPIRRPTRIFPARFRARTASRPSPATAAARSVTTPTPSLDHADEHGSGGESGKAPSRRVTRAAPARPAASAAPGARRGAG